MLVAGTCIGAGMLSLPVSTAAGGFYPSTMAFFFCWAMMTASAFLMLEVSLWYPEETNLITMARSTLGKTGEVVAWCTYVLFLYALMTAYTTGAMGMIASVLERIGLESGWYTLGVLGLFGLVVYFGTRSVDWVNRLFMIGLVATYVFLIGQVLPKVSPTLLNERHPEYLWSVGPLLVTSFGFHLLIPSLKNYLHSNVKALRWSILLGSLLPLLIYLLWEVLILGVIPTQGDQGLIAILHTERQGGEQAIIAVPRLLSDLLENPQVTLWAKSFALCALLTSFIGVALGLFDFFADGFKIPKSKKGRLVLALLTFVPPALIATFYPRFMLALHYAGIFAAILLVIFPAMMAWSGRYCLKTATGYRVGGGKILILLILLFGIGVIALEALEHAGVLPMPFVEKQLVE